MNKINTEYGSVEFNPERGYNIKTKDFEGTTKEHPLEIIGEISKAERMLHLSYLQGFMDEVLFEELYVGNTLFEYLDGETIMAVFLVNGEHRVGVVRQHGEIYPTLFAGDEDNYIIINFEYSGKELENFFSEINKDIDSLVLNGSVEQED